MYQKKNEKTLGLETPFVSSLPAIAGVHASIGVGVRRCRRHL